MHEKMGLFLFIGLALCGCSDSREGERVGISCWSRSEIDEKSRRASEGEVWLYARLADNAALCRDSGLAKYWMELALKAGEPSACHRKINDLREAANILSADDPKKIELLRDALRFVSIMRANSALTDPRNRDQESASYRDLSAKLAAEIEGEINSISDR